jgi:ribose/xylose/arabinose/galactoside ABC-type transport system permease subunit
MIVAIPLGMGAAALAGLVNGVGVAYGDPAFIMTLGMLSFARGLAFIYTGGTPMPINNESFYAFGNGYFAGVPIPSLILIATSSSRLVLQLTPFGRSVTPSAPTRKPPGFRRSRQSLHDWSMSSLAF